MELTFNGQIEPGYIKEVKDILENREFMQLGSVFPSPEYIQTDAQHQCILYILAYSQKGWVRCKNGRRAGLLHDFCIL